MIATRTRPEHQTNKNGTHREHRGNENQYYRPLLRSLTPPRGVPLPPLAIAALAGRYAGRRATSTHALHRLVGRDRQDKREMGGQSLGSPHALHHRAARCQQPVTGACPSIDKAAKRIVLADNTTDAKPVKSSLRTCPIYVANYEQAPLQRPATRVECKEHGAAGHPVLAA